MMISAARFDVREDGKVGYPRPFSDTAQAAEDEMVNVYADFFVAWVDRVL